MNGTILLILLVVFLWVSSDGSCPVRPKSWSLWSFLNFFVVMALTRDYLDFRWAWPFVYPVSEENAKEQMMWPMTYMMKAASLSRWIKTGILLIAADVAVLCLIGFWNFQYWTAACS